MYPGGRLRPITLKKVKRMPGDKFTTEELVLGYELLAPETDAIPTNLPTLEVSSNELLAPSN